MIPQDVSNAVNRTYEVMGRVIQSQHVFLELSGEFVTEFQTLVNALEAAGPLTGPREERDHVQAQLDMFTSFRKMLEVMIDISSKASRANLDPSDN